MGAYTVVVEHDAEQAGLIRKAVNLFTFLGRAQQLLVKPIRTVDKFEKVMWFGDLPEHPGVDSAHRGAAREADAPLLSVARVPKLDPPALPKELIQWVEGSIADLETEPTLREAIYTHEPIATGDHDGDDVEQHRLQAADVPGLTEAFESWIADWRLCAETARCGTSTRSSSKYT